MPTDQEVSPRLAISLCGVLGQGSLPILYLVPGLTPAEEVALHDSGITAADQEEASELEAAKKAIETGTLTSAGSALWGSRPNMWW